MPRINASELRNVDLNLLLVFATMMEEGTVTGTAARLYLTQPAISASLSRLREVVGEDLFVRAGRGLAPTPRAHALFAEVRAGLHAMERGLFERTSFEPTASSRVFRVGLPDDLELLLVPALAATLAAEAPRVRLVVRPVDFRTALGALESESVELVVSVLDEVPEHVAVRSFAGRGFVCLFDPRLVRLGPTPTLEEYLAARHVVVSYNGDLAGIVEDVLGRSGVRRDVALSLPRFASIPAVLASAPLVATVPRAFAERLAREHGLGVAQLPLSLPDYALQLAWHRATDTDPGLVWLRERVAAALPAATASRALDSRKKRRATRVARSSR